MIMTRTLLALFCAVTLSSCGSSSPTTTSGGNAMPFTSSPPPSAASGPAPTSYAQSALAIPVALNDTFFGTKGTWSATVNDLWGFDMLSAFSQFPLLSLPLQEIVVAIVDTGVDYDAPDLAGRLWMNGGERGDGKESNGIDDDGDGYVDDFLGWNWVNDNNNPLDDAGHGSHLAGTIAATGGNAEGVVGIAPWVRIMVLKVCDSRGSCLSSDVRAGIQYAVSHGAKVINISLGGAATASDTAAFDALITDAANQGVVVVTAAGNSSTDATAVVPGNATHAVTVSAHADDGELCSTFSNTGLKVDVSAPGCGFNGVSEISAILSVNSRRCGAGGTQSCCLRTPVGDGRYCHMKGTSMATPHVSGLAALAFTASPSATPLMVRQALLKQSVKTAGMGAQDKSVQHGYGRASAAGLGAEASQAPGLKITSPRIFTSSANHTIQFRLEARSGEDVTWQMRAIPYSGTTNVNLSGGVAVGSGGTVLAGNSASLSQAWTPAGSGTFVVVVEAVAGGRIYRDSTALRAP